MADYRAIITQALQQQAAAKSAGAPRVPLPSKKKKPLTRDKNAQPASDETQPPNAGDAGGRMPMQPPQSNTPPQPPPRNIPRGVK